MPPEPMSASDGFAIAMLAMILCSMGVIAMLIFCMFRNASKRDPQVDELLDEMAEDERKSKVAGVAAEPSESSELWERGADWWKS